MKKTIGVILAAALVAPAIAVPASAEAKTKVVHRTIVVKDRHWHKGERFDRRQARNYTVVDYRHYRGLRAPPRGYHYVRSGNDVLLVGITSGIVSAVFANLLR